MLRYVQRPSKRRRAPELAWRGAARHVRHRQRARLRPGVGEVPRARRRAGASTDRARARPFHARSPTPCYNHVGHFASGRHAVCKSLFLGGVSRRFPELRFLFLEGGVGWARVTARRPHRPLGEAQPRRARARQRSRGSPTSTSSSTLSERYGGSLWRRDDADELARRWARPPRGPDDASPACRSTRGRAATLFVERFYFGCEGDDPVTASAFDAERNPGGARGSTRSFGSDIGHWDVPHGRGAGRGVRAAGGRAINDDDLRDFVFTNPVQLWTSANPTFFGAPSSDAATVVDDPSRVDPADRLCSIRSAKGTAR